VNVSQNFKIKALSNRRHGWQNEVLYRFNGGGSLGRGTVTYERNGKQFVAIAAAFQDSSPFLPCREVSRAGSRPNAADSMSGFGPGADSCGCAGPVRRKT
jgi:hypothetical protein